MRRLLLVLTIVLLILSGLCIFMGSLLFARRELLKGRTQALEKSLIELSALLERPTDPEQRPNSFPERDIDEVSSQLIPNPQTADFWSDYPLFLEDLEQPMQTIRREDLMDYYKRDPATGKVEKDPVTGYPITTGPGTMDATLKKVIEAAKYELDRLNTTRSELRNVREELINTIEDLNGQKQRLRQSLVQITDLNGTIAGLRGDVSRLERNVQDLESDKRNLQDEVAQKNQTIQQQVEDIQIRDDTIKAQRSRIQELTTQLREAQRGLGSGVILASERNFKPGVKGKVVAVNAEWSYAVIELTDEMIQEIDALVEIYRRNDNPGMPIIDVFLRRDDKPIAKVRIVQVKHDKKLAIADILPDWQQAPIEKGDVAFF